MEEIVKACKYIYYKENIAQQARDYLNSRISKNAQDTYDFGYFPSNDHLDILFKYISKEKLEKFFLIKNECISFRQKPRGHFNNHNLIFPFRNSYGKIVSLVGRTLLSEDDRKAVKIQKYNYTYGTRKAFYVYGLNIAKKAILEKDFVILVEGQFDCIALHEHNILNTVALGWADMSILQLNQVARYTKNIIILLDNDEAGQKGVQKIEKLYGNYFNLKTMSVPECKDIDEFLKKDINSDLKDKLLYFN